MTGFPANWIAAAAYERDRRQASYPKLIAAGEINEERGTIDYQAWCAIAEWMEQGRCYLIGEWAGAGAVDDTVLTWALLEQSAESALDSIQDRIEAALSADPVDQAKLAWLQERRDAVWCIHNLMVKQREVIEPTARADTAWARPPAVAATSRSHP